MAVTVSEKPWSDYTAADYTPEQWHAACLIHQHEGAPTSKNQCKLPVRTPTGTINRNGVHAAAAALAGARGGVNASAEEKAKAAAALRGLYSKLDEEPPESLKHAFGEEFVLDHSGVKGMKWGVRRTDAQLGHKPTPSEDKARAQASASKIAKGDTSALSNQELQSIVSRMNLEQQYSRLAIQSKPTPQTVKILKNGGKVITAALAVGATANRVYKFTKSPAGQRLIKEMNNAKYKSALAKQARGAAKYGQGTLF